MLNEIPLKGNLRYFGLSKLLSEYNDKKKTGILTLINGDVRKSIYFRDGKAVFASSNQEDDRLGNMLIRNGIITREENDNAVKMSKRLGKLYGSLLISLGYIKPKELFLQLKHQVKDVILDIFSWDDSEFIFRNVPPPEDIITLELGMDDLIREGIISHERNKRRKSNTFFQKVNEIYNGIEKLSYYEVLKVGMDATSGDIKKSFLNMAREFHPDRSQELDDPVVEEKLTNIFTLINKAYHTLSDRAEKREYDSELLGRKTTKPVDRTIVRAEEQYNRGIDEYKTGNFWGATDFFRGATRTDPGKAKYWANLSLSLSKIPKRLKEAEETMLKAIMLETHNAGYYVHLGVIYLASGLDQRAVQQFESALKWDPVNRKAIAELEILKGRLKGKKNKK